MHPDFLGSIAEDRARELRAAAAAWRRAAEARPRRPGDARLPAARAWVAIVRAALPPTRGGA
ncbi:MAG TPA: hypothetical protein VHJ34_05490 [Actinomycetota bacterium]|nr:hypothetical protein [Actinomycetota bacterium]